MFFLDWVDFQKEYKEKINFKRDISLKDSVNMAGMDFIGRQHDALYDARNTANLLRLVRTPNLYKKTLEKVADTLSAVS